MFHEFRFHQGTPLIFKKVQSKRQGREVQMIGKIIKSAWVERLETDRREDMEPA